MVWLILMRNKSSLVKRFAANPTNKALKMIGFVHGGISFIEDRLATSITLRSFLRVALVAVRLTVVFEIL